MPVDLSNDTPPATSVLKRTIKRPKVKPISNSAFFAGLGGLLVVAGVLLSSTYGNRASAYVFLTGLAFFFLGLFVYLFKAVFGIWRKEK